MNKATIFIIVLLLILATEVYITVLLYSENNFKKDGWICNGGMCSPADQQIHFTEPPNDCPGKCDWCDNFHWQCEGCRVCNPTRYNRIIAPSNFTLWN